MDLVPLTLMALAGLVALGSAVRLAFPPPSSPLGAAEHAAAALCALLPGTCAADVVQSRDGRAALAASPGRPEVGLLVAVGRHRTARLLARGDVRRVEARAGGRLHLDLADFTCPRARLLLTPAEADAWRERLQPLSEAHRA